MLTSLLVSVVLALASPTRPDPDVQALVRNGFAQPFRHPEEGLYLTCDPWIVESDIIAVIERPGFIARALATGPPSPVPTLRPPALSVDMPALKVCGSL